MGFNSGFKGLSQGTAQVSNLSGTRHDFLGTRHFDVCVSWADSMALAFLAKGELWRHRIRNWYVYRVSRDIERSYSINNDPRNLEYERWYLYRCRLYVPCGIFADYEFCFVPQLWQTVAQYNSTTAFCNLWWHYCTVIFVGNNNKIH